MNITDILPTVGTAGLWGLVAAIIVAAIRAEPILRKISLEAQGRKDGLQAARITELERRMDAEKAHCDSRLDQLNTRIIIVAQSTMELSTVVEHHAPDSPSLARARVALKHAFPINFDTPGDLLAKARKLGEM